MSNTPDNAIALSGMSGWKHHMLSCFDNFGICALTFCCPCYVAGKNAQAVGENCLFYGALTCLEPAGAYSRAYVRAKVQEKEGLPADFVSNFLIHLTNPCCAMIQEYKQLGGTLPVPKKPAAAAAAAAEPAANAEAPATEEVQRT
ncbi:uncharacterized protein LOC144920781 [Branchiostoma floridae x Branchiostoma belcheri]